MKPWAYCRNQPRKCVGVCVCALLRANSVVLPCLGGPPPQAETGEFEVSNSETWATHRRIVGTVWHPDWTVVKVMFAENDQGDRRATQCRSGSDRGSYVQTGGGVLGGNVCCGGPPLFVGPTGPVVWIRSVRCAHASRRNHKVLHAYSYSPWRQYRSNARLGDPSSSFYSCVCPWD